MTDQIEQKFQKKGLKLTDQRRTIARVILESKEAYGESDHPNVFMNIFWFIFLRFFLHPI